jgi:hypothetical protein
MIRSVRNTRLVATRIAMFVALFFVGSESIAQTCAAPTCWTGSFYQYEVVAQAGQANSVGIFSGFGTGPSINENGTVAFVGQVQNNSGQALGDTPFIGEIGSGTATAVAPSFLSPSRTFGNALQINDANQVATQDRFAGSPPFYYLRVWNGNQQNTFTLVAQSSKTGFQAVLGNPAIDFSNDVAFSALNQTFSGVLVKASPPYTQLNQVTMTTPLSPLIADNGYTVARAGNTNTSPIMLYGPNLTSPITIADSTAFSALGQSPGISRDGTVIAFAGDLVATGTWDSYVGPGIFIAVVQNGDVQYRARVAGFHYNDQDGMKLIQMDTKSSPNVPLEGVPWCDSPALVQTCMPFGELEDLPPFSSPTPVYFNTFTESGFQSSTEWENRIAVTHSPFGIAGIDDDTVEVSFIATPNMADTPGLALFTQSQGLWTVRADLFVRKGKLLAQVYRPIPVIQIGSPLGNLGSTVTGIGTYDPLSNFSPEQANGDHQLGFWVSTSSGSSGQMILRASYIQQYGTSGFNGTKCTPPLCQAGTMGALAFISGANYVMSNDHVFGRPVSTTQNAATTTDSILEPAPLDYVCENSVSIGTFFDAPTLSSGVDAAMASLGAGEINSTGQIYNIGIPSSIASASVGEHVAKQGRSSALTCGTVRSTTFKVSIPYKGCTGTKFSMLFAKQIVIASADDSYPFSLAGDSGSLIVDAGTAQPIGLVFGGTTNDSYSFANPIGTVLTALDNVAGQTVTLASGPKHVIAGCHFSEPEVILPKPEESRANMIEQRYEKGILLDPAVIGIGVGADETDRTKAAILIVVEAGRSYLPLPASLGGIPVRVIFSSRPRPLSYGNCDKQSHEIIRRTASPERTSVQAAKFTKQVTVGASGRHFALY